MRDSVVTASEDTVAIHESLYTLHTHKLLSYLAIIYFHWLET